VEILARPERFAICKKGGRRGPPEADTQERGATSASGVKSPMCHLVCLDRPRLHRFVVTLAAATSLGSSTLQGIDPVEPPPVIFEGFGLEAFAGAGSVAAALHRTGAQAKATTNEMPKLDLKVHGPTGRDAVNAPLAAEVHSRIERFDIAAGMGADPTVIQEGPATWTGRIGMKNERDEGSEAIELRTTLGRWHTNGTLGLEVGPRIERRLGRATFFIDGKAEARAVRAEDTGWWARPGTSAADGAGMVGVTARTGLVR